MLLESKQTRTYGDEGITLSGELTSAVMVQDMIQYFWAYKMIATNYFSYLQNIKQASRHVDIFDFWPLLVCYAFNNI